MSKRGRGRPKKIKSDHLIDVDDRGEAMAKSDGKVPYSDELPEFFTFYAHAMCSERLRIPPDFVEKFGGDIPTIVTLSMPSGLSFEVHINRINDHLFFQQGWPEFVHENSLEDGDILTFCYDGNSKLFVKVFAINGCSKRIDDTSRINVSKPIENLKGYEASEPEDCKQNQATRRNLSPKRLLARKSLRRNPSFSVVMSKYYIHKGVLHIPRAFWKVYIRNDGKDSRKVTLWIKNKSWPVDMSTKIDRVQFTKGWRDFVKDNSLENRNLCNFQLIDGDDYAFNVTVNR